MASSRPTSNLSVWSALGIVYVVWGSTYLAIAIAVQTDVSTCASRAASSAARPPWAC